LGENTKESLEFFLRERGIKIASIDYRIKMLDSFFKKMKSKSYEQPFEQIEDFCGIRVVCFFLDDIRIIENILKKEYKIVSKEVKNNKTHQFGYRSHHFTIKIKDVWTKSPNYRGLQNLKIEVQVRTIFMHAWAEIEHTFAYKKTVHIPTEFRQTFNILSTKLEKVDGQFQELANKIQSKNEDIRKQSKKEKTFDKELPLNLDTLQLFLDYFFPNKQKSIKNTRDLLDELIFRDLTIRNLIAIIEKHSKQIALLQKQGVLDTVQTDEFRRIMDES
jgi:ppGpp synthetase/RelA/SpoT-type nucleotidyltranferase